MLSFLQQIDTDIFLALNGNHAPLWDYVMFAVSDKWIWIPLYIFLLYMAKKRQNVRQTLLFLGMIVLAVAFADQICSSVIRPLVCRVRPGHPDSPICDLVLTVNGYRGGHYGFPSCHAANSAALAAFICLFYRRKAITACFVGWVALLCFSRIYLGVHYPGDLLVGASIGTICGAAAYTIYSRLRYRPYFTTETSVPGASLFRKMRVEG